MIGSGYVLIYFSPTDSIVDLGSRIFATPAIILRSSGSVGMALVMWLVGAAVACTGMAVYLELGTVSALFACLPIKALTILNVRACPEMEGRKSISSSYTESQST